MIGTFTTFDTWSYYDEGQKLYGLSCHRCYKPVPKAVARKCQPLICTKWSSQDCKVTFCLECYKECTLSGGSGATGRTRRIRQQNRKYE